MGLFVRNSLIFKLIATMKIKKYLFFYLFLGFSAQSGSTMAQQLNAYKLNWSVNEFADVKSQSQKVELFEEAVFDVQLKHMPIWNKKFAGNFTDAVLVNPILKRKFLLYLFPLYPSEKIPKPEK